MIILNLVFVKQLWYCMPGDVRETQSVFAPGRNVYSWGEGVAWITQCRIDVQTRFNTLPTDVQYKFAFPQHKISCCLYLFPSNYHTYSYLRQGEPATWNAISIFLIPLMMLYCMGYKFRPTISLFLSYFLKPVHGFSMVCSQL